MIFGFHLNNRLFGLMGGDGAALFQKPGQLWFMIALALGWVSFASIVRRLHDRGKSAWWSLAYLIPGLGQIWCIVECGFLEGRPGVNRHGPPPQHADVYAILARQLAQRPAAPAAATRPAASDRDMRPRRWSLPASNPASAVARRSAVNRIEPQRRNLSAAFVVALAIILGIVTVALTIDLPLRVVPVGANPDLPVFKPTGQNPAP